jgi:hypothetical protein
MSSQNNIAPDAVNSVPKRSLTSLDGTNRKLRFSEAEDISYNHSHSNLYSSDNSRIRNSALFSDSRHSTNIVYEVFEPTEDPTCMEWLLNYPRSGIHFLKNLSQAFGWKFVFLVCMVYGLQQGMYVIMCLHILCTMYPVYL